MPLPSITSNPELWYGHEMLFGFAAAAIAGFLLTAVANCTKRPSVSGFPLLVVFARELIAAGNRQNFKFAAPLILYAAVNAGIYFALFTGN